MLRAKVAVVVVAALGGLVWADWNPGDPYKMHWPQLPNLGPTGMDVYDTTYWAPTGLVEQKWLGDDFLCTQSGPITGIHVWGSWLFDRVPSQGIDHGTFDVAIYSDIPANQSPTGYSMPGQMLWHATFRPGMYQVRLYAQATEQFYDPNAGQVIGTDNLVFQYNFFIPPPLAFYQQQNSIYWLVVTNYDPNNNGMIDPYDHEFIFGWKTTRLAYNFNDDATFVDTPLGYPPILPPPGAIWGEMRYPFGHPWAGESINLAFVITPEPSSLLLLALGGLGLIQYRRRR